MFFRKFLIPLFLMALCALAACTPRSVNRTMDRAELLADSIPDSAYRLMASIDPAKIHSASSRARYALLRTYTLYRTDRPIDSDSLIAIAVKYYTGNPDTHILPLTKAHFLRGYILRDLGELRSAMDDAMIAHILAEQSPGNYLWQAKTAELVSDILCFSQNPGEAVRFNQLTIDRYRSAGRSRNVLFSLCDKASILSALHRHDEAIALFDSIADIARKQSPFDTGVLAYNINGLVRPLALTEDYQRLASSLAELTRYDSDYNQNSDRYSMMALEQIHNGNFRKADSLFHIAEVQARDYRDILLLHYVKAQYFKQRNQPQEYIREFEKIWECNYEFINSLYAQPAISAQRDFYQQQASDEKNLRINISVIMAVCIIIAAVIITILVMLSRTNIRAKNAEIANRVTEIMNLTDQLSRANAKVYAHQESSKEMQKIYQDIDNLFKDQWSTINMLCNDFFEKGDNENTRRIIVANIEKHLLSLAKPQNIISIENSVNRYMNNIMARLRNECESFKETDFVFIMLIMAGFSPRAVCMFTDIKLKNYYTKRARLIERIRKINPSCAEEAISRLS